MQCLSWKHGHEVNSENKANHEEVKFILEQIPGDEINLAADKLVHPPKPHQ